jgi:hypothetical protein
LISVTKQRFYGFWKGNSSVVAKPRKPELWKRNGLGMWDVSAVSPPSSGTAALYMALTALNNGPGDELIVPSYTFLAIASCVLHA